MNRTKQDTRKKTKIPKTLQNYKRNSFQIKEKKISHRKLSKTIRRRNEEWLRRIETKKKIFFSLFPQKKAWKKRLKKDSFASALREKMSVDIHHFQQYSFTEEQKI